MLLLSDAQMGKAWEISQALLFYKLGSTGQKCTFTFFPSF